MLIKISERIPPKNSEVNFLMPRITQERKNEIRNQFLDSAQKIFQEKGYAQTTMDDIVKASGTSKGAIYWYFKSKEELFQELHKRQLQQSILLLKDTVAGEDPASVKLRRIAQFYFASQDEKTRQQIRLNVEFDAASLNIKAIQNRFRSHYVIFQDFLIGLLNEGIETKEFSSKLDTDSIATLIVAVLDGLALRWAITDTPLDWNRVQQALTNLVLTGISNTAEHSQDAK